MKPSILRFFSLAVALCGAAIYAVLLWTWWLEWQQGAFAAKPFVDQAWFVVNDGIFLSGLPPMLLAIYFLVLKKSARANARGLIYVAVFIPIHYYVAAAAAHGTPAVYLTAELIELAAALALIWRWRDEQPVGAAASSA